MDLTIIADTHGLHDNLKLKKGTMLIHAGDITEYGTEEEVIDFLKWFSRQPFQYKIFIAGNHDLFFEECSTAKRNKLIAKDIIYLQNSGIEIEGLKIWGSPVTPYFLGMAFNARPGKEIKKLWNKIPLDTDILITHGPPKGILDHELGCEELLNKVSKIGPSIHCFGHIHGWNGKERKNQTTFVNAAMVNRLEPLEEAEYTISANPAFIQTETILNPEKILFLNNLNSILKKVEQEIIAHVSEVLILAEKRFRDKKTLTNDFGVEAIVRYSLKDMDDYYSFLINFNYQTVVVDKNYGFFLESNAEKDKHRIGRMPALEELYCYLLRNLMDHNKLYFSIYDIKKIDIEIFYTDQKTLKINVDGTVRKISLSGKGKAVESPTGKWITI